MAKEKTKKHHKRGNKTSSYFLTPIIYVLVSMIVVIPVLIGGMHFAVNTVHNAQETLSIDYNDISVSDDADGDAMLDICEYVGTVECERVGLYSPVYYGINRVSLREGCGLGYNGELKRLFGYSSTVFKPLNKLEVGDAIILSTSAEKTKYKVTSIYDKDVSDSVENGLVLCTTKDSSPFSIYDKARAFVVAEEVQ